MHLGLFPQKAAVEPSSVFSQKTTIFGRKT